MGVLAQSTAAWVDVPVFEMFESLLAMPIWQLWPEDGMSQMVAAIKSGTDPVVALPAATFHRTLEEAIYCPKCEATYMLVVDYDWAVSRYFAEESRRHIAMLKKAVTMGHAAGHRVTHFECNGVIVTRHVAEAARKMAAPMPKHVM